MVYLIIIGVIFGIDQFLKKYIEDNYRYGRKESMLDEKIEVTKVYNRGICLNHLENKPNFVKIASTAMLSVIMVILAFQIPRKGKKLLKFGLALTIGGAASNIVDRLRKGYVVDYFSFKKVKKIKSVIFNLGDIFIMVGTSLLALYSIFHKE